MFPIILTGNGFFGLYESESLTKTHLLITHLFVVKEEITRKTQIKHFILKWDIQLKQQTWLYRRASWGDAHSSQYFFFF